MLDIVGISIFQHLTKCFIICIIQTDLILLIIQTIHKIVTGQDIELVPRGEDVGATEEAEINWQEKLLSEREMLKYGDAENCYTVRDRQYHK